MFKMCAVCRYIAIKFCPSVKKKTIQVFVALWLVCYEYYYNHHTYNSICTMSTTLGYVLTCPCICYTQCKWNFCAWNIVYPFLIRRYLDTKDESKTIFRDSPERKSITLYYFRYVYSNMNSCTLLSELEEQSF